MIQDKYFYFRTEADVDDDAAISDSLYVPVKKLTGMTPHTTTLLKLFFEPVQNENANEVNEQGGMPNDEVNLTVTAGQMKQVMQAICRAVTSNKLYGDGKIVVADDAAVALDNSAMVPVYLHPGITACASISSTGMSDDS